MGEFLLILFTIVITIKTVIKTNKMRLLFLSLIYISIASLILYKWNDIYPFEFTIEFLSHKNNLPLSFIFLTLILAPLMILFEVQISLYKKIIFIILWIFFILYLLNTINIFYYVSIILMLILSSWMAWAIACYLIDEADNTIRKKNILGIKIVVVFCFLSICLTGTARFFDQISQKVEPNLKNTIENTKINS